MFFVYDPTNRILVLNPTLLGRQAAFSVDDLRKHRTMPAEPFKAGNWPMLVENMMGEPSWFIDEAQLARDLGPPSAPPNVVLDGDVNRAIAMAKVAQSMRGQRR